MNVKNQISEQNKVSVLVCKNIGAVQRSTYRFFTVSLTDVGVDVGVLVGVDVGV